MQSFITLVIALIILGAGGTYMYNDHNDTRTRLAEAQVAHNAAATNLQGRRQILAALADNHIAFQRIIQTTATIDKELKHYEELRGQVAAEQQRALGLLESRRGGSVGQEIKEVQLKSLKVLHDVRIMKVEPDALTLLSSDGVVKVSPDQLPDHLQKYFRFDIVTRAATPPPPPTSEEITFKNQSISRDVQADFRARTDRLRANITNLSKQISALQRAKNGPLGGIDSYLKPGTKAHEYRKRIRDGNLDAEIKTVTAQHKAAQAEFDAHLMTRPD